MKSQIVRIGNSQGIRIPKVLLDQTGLHGDIEIKVQDDGLVISPSKPPRSGWSEAFKQMAKKGDDRLLDTSPSGSTWDEEEWEWQ